MAKKSQIQKFREAARAAETHDSEKRFDDALKSIAKHSSKTADSEDGDSSTKAKPRKAGR
jgi:hypothetical protein